VKQQEQNRYTDCFNYVSKKGTLCFDRRYNPWPVHERFIMKIIDYRKLTDKKWINLFDITYLDKAGQTHLWQVATRDALPRCVTENFDHADAVMMIPFHRSQEKLVLIREYRVPLAGFQYEFPAGLIDPGESIEAAARRELKEETGLDLTVVHEISPVLYSTAGMTDESLVLVYCDCDGSPSSSQNQGTETIEVDFISSAKARKLLTDASQKMDAKAWLALTQFSNRRFF
jgi:ADP-ribose pyrophosphatase